MSEENGTPNEGEQQQEQTFTQADVDAAVKKIAAKIRADEREKFADYEALKAQAEGAKTAEQRIADLEKRLADADAREARSKLVAQVAAAHEITDPEDIRLFLTGSDEDTLTAQAERLAAREGEKRRQGNYVPNEGRTTTNPGDVDMRKVARELFN